VQKTFLSSQQRETQSRRRSPTARTQLTRHTYNTSCEGVQVERLKSFFARCHKFAIGLQLRASISISTLQSVLLK